MIRFIPFKSYLIFPLIAYLLALPSCLMGRPSPVSQGNIIKSMVVNKRGQDMVLTIQGELNPAQLAGISIRQEGKSKNFSLTLPNTMIDTETLPSSSLKFSDNPVLEGVQMEEELISDGEDKKALPIVKLAFQGKKVINPELVKPIQKNALEIRFKDTNPEKVTVKRNVQEKKVVFERKQMLITQKTAMGIRKIYRKPTLMQVSILNASGSSERAYKLSVYLGDIQKKYIEKTLGCKLDITNISKTAYEDIPVTTLYFKENFLKNALLLSQLIPGEQRIVPMRHQKELVGVDIKIYIGKDYR